MASEADSLNVIENQGQPRQMKNLSAGKARKPDSPEKIRDACREFEAIFLRQLFKEAHLDRAFGDEEEKANLYGDLIIESLAKSAAAGGGIGLGEMLYREFTQQNSEPESAPGGMKLEKIHESDH